MTRCGATRSPASCWPPATPPRSWPLPGYPAGRSARPGSRARPCLPRPTRRRTACTGRLDRVQRAFDELVAAGHGERWGDVPGEALLTLGDSGPVLRDAWPQLRAAPGEGLRRLCRLVDQRLRDDTGVVRAAAVEPLITLLLEDEGTAGPPTSTCRACSGAGCAPWSSPAPRPGTRSAFACATGSRPRAPRPTSRLQAEREAAAAARAALSPEEIEEERQLRAAPGPSPAGNRLSAGPAPPPPGGSPRDHRRSRWSSSSRCSVPDLGDQGEEILRRVARDAPVAARPRGGGTGHRPCAGILPARVPRRADRGLLPGRGRRRVRLPRGRHQAPPTPAPSA